MRSTTAVSGEEDCQKRLQQAGMSKHARISKMQLEDDDGNRHQEGSAMKGEQKQQKDTEQIIAAIQSLQKDMACLKEKVERQPQTQCRRQDFLLRGGRKISGSGATPSTLAINATNAPFIG